MASHEGPSLPAQSSTRLRICARDRAKSSSSAMTLASNSLQDTTLAMGWRQSHSSARNTHGWLRSVWAAMPSIVITTELASSRVSACISETESSCARQVRHTAAAHATAMLRTCRSVAEGLAIDTSGAACMQGVNRCTAPCIGALRQSFTDGLS